MELEKNTHEHACTFYMKWYLWLNNYKHGDEMRIFVIVADEFNVHKIGISIGLISYWQSRWNNNSIIKT
jgi:hypothetical protein